MRNLFPHANYIPKEPIPIDPERRAKVLAKRRLLSNAWYRRNKGKVFASNVKWAKKALKSLRFEVFSAYGGKCSCCGETNYGFLSIDHINRDGKADRAKHRNRFGQLYSWLKENDYPRDRYRLMCMNCNWGSRHTGTCPHKAERLTVA